MDWTIVENTYNDYIRISRNSILDDDIKCKIILINNDEKINEESLNKQYKLDFYRSKTYLNNEIIIDHEDLLELINKKYHKTLKLLLTQIILAKPYCMLVENYSSQNQYVGELNEVSTFEHFIYINKDSANVELKKKLRIFEIDGVIDTTLKIVDISMYCDLNSPNTILLINKIYNCID